MLLFLYKDLQHFLIIEVLLEDWNPRLHFVAKTDLNGRGANRAMDYDIVEFTFFPFLHCYDFFQQIHRECALQHG